jgi:CRISPR-associated exonuclease Cas4
MTFTEDELLPISALQHLLFCERQCALIHVEQVWQENRLTAEGKVLHEKAHQQGHETRTSVRSVRSLHLRSLAFGISGVADVVEFHAPAGQRAAELSEDSFWAQKSVLRGWKVFPIEYKRGKRKTTRVDEVQLCAQALCLEEMLDTNVPDGAIFYGQEQGRVGIAFDPGLRNLTAKLCIRLREVLCGQVTPAAIRKPSCRRCSLIDICMPEVTAGHESVESYFATILANNLSPLGPVED